MAIELPSEVAQFLSFLGIPWINVNEDKVKEFATHTRQFAQNISDAHGDADATLKKLGSGYEGAAYDSLMQMWGGKSTKHVNELVDGCHVLASALDVGHDVIRDAKMVCLGDLAVMAGSFVLDQGAAIFTGGLAEMAVPAIEEAAEKVVQFAVQQIEQYVIGELTNMALQPLIGKIEQMVVGLVIPEGGGSGGQKGSGFKIDHDQVTAHAQVMQTHAEKVTGHVSSFTSKVDGLDFTS